MAEEKKPEAPKPNRAERRQKPRKITIADMRGWMANGIRAKLFTPKKV